jgi:hypothetical protein
MVRSILCALHLLLALMFTLSGCAKRVSTLRPSEPLEDACGLCPGTPAPEIDGEDIDGAAFKLSDYRGQVVLLDFWGNW